MLYPLHLNCVFEVLLTKNSSAAFNGYPFVALSCLRLFLPYLYHLRPYTTAGSVMVIRYGMMIDDCLDWLFLLVSGFDFGWIECTDRGCTLCR